MKSVKQESIEVKELLNCEIEPKPLISVIIPVYNVEKYLERCLKSVLKQSYKNLEIILVDDGSLDSSGTICDAYCKKDPRVRVTHQENQGLSAARNKGAQLAKGDYITFIDSDDEIVSEYIQIMIAASYIFHADIIQTKIVIEDNQTPGIISNADKCKIQIFQPGKDAANDMHYKVTACAKLFYASVVKNNPFPLYRIHEDDASYYRFAYEANKVCILDYYTYIYYQTDNSIMRSTDKKRDEKTDYIPIYYDRIDFFCSKKEEELLIGSRNRFCLITILKYAAYKKNGTNTKDLPELIRIFKEQYMYIRREKQVSFARRCIYRMFYYFPNITATMIGLVRK